MNRQRTKKIAVGLVLLTGLFLPIAANAQGSPGATVVNTYWDMQQPASMGRMIDWRFPGQFIHFGYTYSSDDTTALRVAGYNSYDAISGLWTYSTLFGCSVNPPPPDQHACYVNLDVDPEADAMVLSGHADTAGNATYMNHAWYGFIQGDCWVTASRIDTSAIKLLTIEGGAEVIWPRVEYQVSQDLIDSVTYLFCYEKSAGGTGILLLFRKLGMNYAGTWDAVPFVPDTVTCPVPAQVISASRVTNNVVLCWVNEYGIPDEFGLQHYDVYFRESSDNGWTWGPKVNLTDYQSTGGNYTAWPDLSCLYDTYGNIHIVWVARDTSSDTGPTGYPRASRLYHWNEFTDAITVVHYADWEPPECAGGENTLNIAKPSISECNDRMYVTWVQFNDVPNGITDDCLGGGDPEWSANGEIFLSVSATLDGYVWDRARNLTNTYTPGCEAPGCGSENWPVMSRYGMDESVGGPYLWPGNATVDPSGTYFGDHYLHAQYVQDLCPGAAILDEGQFTDNPIKWIRLACVDPIEEPLIWVDSGALSGTVFVDHGVESEYWVYVENRGNTDLTLWNIQTNELQGSEFGWLQASETFMVIPPGVNSIDSFAVFVNNGGIIDHPGWSETLLGEIQIEHDASKGTVVIPVQAEIIDTVEFEPPVEDFAGDFYYVRAADLDRDNYMDVVYCGNTTDGLNIAYGTPSGTLETPVTYSGISQASIEIDYINPDTLIDIVAVTNTHIHTLMNNGSRSFTQSSIATKGGGLRDIVPGFAAGYFNEDGFDYIDLIVAPGDIYIGTGDGTFDRETLGITFESVNVSDFDLDGRDDIVVLSGNEIIIYINDGGVIPQFSDYSHEQVGTPDLEVAPSHVVADFSEDSYPDYAMVVPLANPTGQSAMAIGIGDGTGYLSGSEIRAIDGVAYDLVTADPNKDSHLDLVVANGTHGRLEFYFGDGLGAFSDPQFYDLEAGADITYILAALDLDRDGNGDFVSGGVDDGNIVVVINDDDDDPIIVDEMFVTGYEHASVKVTNPNGQVISQNLQTVPGADYWRLDFDGDGAIDGQSIDYNVQHGEYFIEIIRYETFTGGLCAMGIGVNGTTKASIFHDYGPDGRGSWDGGTLEFYYEIEPVSSIQPPNGIPVSNTQPTFDWSGLGIGAPPYSFQLDCYHDMRGPIYDLFGLAVDAWSPPTPLGEDSIFYWRVRTEPSGDWSRVFAAFIAGGSCCIPPSVGDLDQGGGALGFNYDGADLSAMINGLFIDPTNGWDGICLDEADVDFTSVRPVTDPMFIDGADLSLLIDALFIAPTHYLKNCDGTDNY
ncbi:MAG: hypothetical protein DRP45_01110 [Candidatus Zixiibacteriota bacterium]|nr:MAG: hypothetical protein DRP45_01110 [candidate division Zixibacteria bacterium]